MTSSHQSLTHAGHPTPGKPTPSGPGRDRERARAKRSEGQWALGQREPLNGAEQIKKDDNPLHVRARIENVYAHRGFDSIHGDDLRDRFRAWGLYTQRKPGLDGGKTGALAPEELDAEFFMMRVRSDGALLGAAQLRVLGALSTEFARDTADITDRQNIQYHWIRIEDVPSDLAAAGGRRPADAGGLRRLAARVPRLAGGRHRRATRSSTAPPRCEEIKRRFIGNPAFSNLPRKFKTALSGHPSQDVAPEINDVSFVGTVHPEHGPGFDLWVGGGLSTNPMLAQKLGVWIPLDEVRRRLGGRGLDLPRLRLPAAALAGTAEVPRRRLGRREVPRRCWRRSTSPARSSTAPLPRSPVGERRPHRRARAEGRPVLPRRRAHRRPDLRPDAARRLADLVEEYGAQWCPPHGVPEARRPRRRARAGRAFGGRAGPDRALGPALALAPRDHGLHRASSSASSPSSTPRTARPPSSTSSSVGSRAWTPRSPSTSTAAPTPAPAPRSPTSVSRASWSWTPTAARSRASRCTSAAASASTRAFGKKLRAHKVTSAELDDYVTRRGPRLPRRP